MPLVMDFPQNVIFRAPTVNNSGLLYFVGKMFNRVRLNTVRGRQIVCLRAWVKYHPTLLAETAKVAPTLKWDWGSFGKYPTDEAISFYSQDFLEAAANIARLLILAYSLAVFEVLLIMHPLKVRVRIHTAVLSACYQGLISVVQNVTL